LCTFFFYLAWSVFLQSHLYLFCNHTAIKLQSPVFAITCIFTKLQPHQAKNNLVTSSFLPVFLQSQSHCYKGAITLRQDLQSTTFWFATVFSFLQSQHISRCKHTAKDVAITSNLTRLQPIKQRPP
jgi:hypothetical protein